MRTGFVMFRLVFSLWDLQPKELHKLFWSAFKFDVVYLCFHFFNSFILCASSASLALNSV